MSVLVFQSFCYRRERERAGCISLIVVHVLLSSSSQAKGTNSTSFLRNEVELVPLACEDVLSCGCVCSTCVLFSNDTADWLAVCNSGIS